MAHLPAGVAGRNATSSFVSSVFDLSPKSVTEKIWATKCHPLDNDVCGARALGPQRTPPDDAPHNGAKIISKPKDSEYAPEIRVRAARMVPVAGIAERDLLKVNAVGEPAGAHMKMPVDHG